MCACEILFSHIDARRMSDEEPPPSGSLDDTLNITQQQHIEQHAAPGAAAQPRALGGLAQFWQLLLPAEKVKA